MHLPGFRQGVRCRTPIVSDSGTITCNMDRRWWHEKALQKRHVRPWRHAADRDVSHVVKPHHRGKAASSGLPPLPQGTVYLRLKGTYKLRHKERETKRTAARPTGYKKRETFPPSMCSTFCIKILLCDSSFYGYEVNAAVLRSKRTS